MAERVQVILQRDEKLRLQRQAAREGISMSGWLRQVALERLAQGALKTRFEKVSELRAFFERCAAIEAGQEPGLGAATKRDRALRSRPRARVRRNRR